MGVDSPQIHLVARAWYRGASGHGFAKAHEGLLIQQDHGGHLASVIVGLVAGSCECLPYRGEVGSPLFPIRFVQSREEVIHIADVSLISF